jgi:hypothetical protein
MPPPPPPPLPVVTELIKHRVIDSSTLTRVLKISAQGQTDRTYTDTQNKNSFRLSSAILNTYSYNSAVLELNNIK